jgi:probable selenate reductase FAD-binding subunit
MLRELTDYYRPKNLREALQLLNQPQRTVVPLAGGTELLARQDTAIEAVVDLQDLELDYIHSDGDGLHIGAMTRVQTLVTDERVREAAHELVSRCAMLSAQHTERNMATIGGSVAVGAAWHDLLLALLVCDAQVELMRSSVLRRVVPLHELLAHRRTHLTPQTLITQITLPTQALSARTAYHRVSRTPADRAIVGVAVSANIAPNGAHIVHVAIGGASDHTMRMPEVEALLAQQELLPRVVDTIQRAVTPPSDHLASSEYRRAMVGVLLRRAWHEVTS